MSDTDAPADVAFKRRCSACGAEFGVTVAVTVEGASKAPQTNHEDRRRRRRPSKIDRDPEVAAFAVQLDATDMLDDVVAAIRERFGDERTPARTTLHRYLQNARREAANPSEWFGMTLYSSVLT